MSTTSDSKSTTKPDKKKGVAGATSDEGQAKAGSGGGGTASGTPKPENQ